MDMLYEMVSVGAKLYDVTRRTVFTVAAGVREKAKAQSTCSVVECASEDGENAAVLVGDETSVVVGDVEHWSDGAQTMVEGHVMIVVGPVEAL